MWHKFAGHVQWDLELAITWYRPDWNECLSMGRNSWDIWGCLNEVHVDVWDARSGSLVLLALRLLLGVQWLWPFFICSCLGCCLLLVGPEFPVVQSKVPNTKTLWLRWLPVRCLVEVSLLVLTFIVCRGYISGYLKGCFYPHVLLHLRATETPKLESSCICRKKAVDQCL